ncbi:Hok/Gef family protein [Nissabacter sp. SGAir0207]|nr:Hok/Gef family protein [Nissabacter sp. SGAir0207]QCR34628.1 Hok/Gef family protein [Nissabacter sp. SGAir0207]
MTHKSVVICLVVICITLLVFTWITRSSLCEIKVKQDTTEVAVKMDYES